MPHVKMNVTSHCVNVKKGDFSKKENDFVDLKRKKNCQSLLQLDEMLSIGYNQKEDDGIRRDRLSPLSFDSTTFPFSNKCDGNEMKSNDGTDTKSKLRIKFKINKHE